MLRAGSLVAGVTTLLLFAADAQAQLFHLGNWEGALEGLVDFARQDTDTGGSQQTKLETRRTEERISLRNAGAHFYDPRLLALSVGGTFGLTQDELTTGESATSRGGRLWGYDGFASVLSEGPLSMNLFANRNQFFLPGHLAGETEVLSENRGATLFARRLYIPSRVSFRQELLDEESRIGDLVSRRDNRVNLVTYEGQRGWADSEVYVGYEFLDNADEVFPNLSYRNHDGSLNYSLDFGPELNWRWDSRTRYFTRTGVSDLTTLTADEVLRIEHTERLRTEYRYFLIRTSTTGGEATTHTGGLRLHHRMYESLTTIAGLDTIIQALPGGERDTYRGLLDFAYTKRLPGTGRLIAGLGGRFQYEDDRFQDQEGFVPQETHTASTPFALAIPLDNPFVVTSSVVVTKIALGPLPPGCIPPSGPPIPLVLGRDYTLSPAGDLTEIVPIACAGSIPGINPGDTIAVDYSFAVPASLRFTTASWHADLGADYGWVRPYYAHQQVEQSLLSGLGGAQFLDDQQSDTLGIELRYDDGRLRANVLGEARRFASQRLAYDSLRSAQFAAFSILPGLTLSVTGDQAHLDFQDPDRKSQTLTGQTTLAYAFGTSLFADVSGGVRALDDTLLPSERTIAAALRVRWTMGQLDISPTLEFFDLQRGDTDTKEFEAILRTIRRF